MLRGEFIRGDGLVIPNNITTFGAQMILDMAIRNADSNLYLGLVSGVPDKSSLKDDLEEPTIGVNGYARVAMARGNTAWPTIGALNGSAFVESTFATWVATGAGFDKEVNRIMLCQELSATTGGYISLSVPMPAPITILSTTPLNLRQFKYKIYLG